MLRGDSVTFLTVRWGELGAERDRLGDATGEGQRLGEPGGEVWVVLGEMNGV